jgi:hypothetical protein
MLFWALSIGGAHRFGSRHVTKAWKAMFCDKLTWDLVVLLARSCYSRKLLQDETLYISIREHNKLQIFREMVVLQRYSYSLMELSPS